MRRPERSTRVRPATGPRRRSRSRRRRRASACCRHGARGIAADPEPQSTVAKAPQEVALSAGEFHGFAATADYLKKVAAAIPGDHGTVEIGRSAGNRPIYVLVVSNMKTGVALDALVPLQNPRKPAANNVTPMKPYQAKPALWIDGGTHGAVLAGTEICLFVIDKLVLGYGADAEVTRLVDDNTFYICPTVFADGGVEAGKPAPRAEAATSANGNYPEGWWKDDETAGGTGDYPSSSRRSACGARVLHEPHEHPVRPVVPYGRRAHGPPVCGWPENRVDPRDAAVFDRVLGRKFPGADWRDGACGVERAARRFAGDGGGENRGRPGGAGRAGRPSRWRSGRAGAPAVAEPQARRAPGPGADGGGPSTTRTGRRLAASACSTTGPTASSAPMP